MKTFFIVGSFLIIFVAKSLGRQRCDCKDFAICAENEKTRFFQKYESCIDFDCFLQMPSMKGLKCVQTHRALLDNVALSNLACVMKTEGMCANRGRWLISSNGRSNGKRSVEKRQTGSYVQEKLPENYRPFGECMRKCEATFGREFTDEEREWIKGEVRPAVLNVMTACMDQLNCDFDLLQATSALTECAKDTSFAEVDQKMYDCLRDAERYDVTKENGEKSLNPWDSGIFNNHQ